jgi:hypothetical protein
MWTTSQINRIAVERAVLQRAGLTQFEIYYASERDAYDVFGTAYSNTRNPYDLWIPIPRGFPDVRPPLYVAKPNPLRDAFGGTINGWGLSHDMHTLTAGPRGMVQICHWRDARWHAAITLHKVLLKGLIWLEAYEQHLTTGKPISSFVTTMSRA